ncbi:MAG: sugar transferase [Leuconostoc pseudomesenteroides]
MFLFLFLILLLPLLIIALIVKLTSKGPILFIQERYGRNSRPFKLYKFRSMTDSTPQIANSKVTDIQNYITPFGIFIGKTSLDELPQLWNIIKKDMRFIVGQDH